MQQGGEVATVGALTRQDVQDFWRTHYRADNAQVAIIGDVTAAQAKTIALRLTGSLPRGAGEVRTLPPVVRDVPAQTRRIAHPATQSHILMGMPGIKRDDSIISRAGRQLCPWRRRLRFAPARRGAPESRLAYSAYSHSRR
jgi:zinc protease